MKTKNKRLKPLLPTLKQKKRYLAFEIVSKSKISDFSEVSKAIWGSALSFAGIKGVAKMGIKQFPKKYKKQKGIIKIAHTEVEALKASLALIKKINNNSVIVRSLGVSGMITKAENKYVVGGI